jgi:hypothetical protein
VARVVAVFDDLLLGSNVQGLLTAGGHEVQLTADPSGAQADVVVVDLGSEGIDGIAVLEGLRGSGARTLGVYSHVHHEVKVAAEAAGYDLVVPRSRMMREGPALVEQLAAG